MKKDESETAMATAQRLRRKTGGGWMGRRRSSRAISLQEGRYLRVYHRSGSGFGALEPDASGSGRD